jgi:glycosyltransferase involved in cell wall biosynthesis
VTLSVVIITYNEEANLPRTLESVMPLVRDGKGEIIVVDSGSTDRTVEIARSFGAKVFVEPWKGYAAQKNSAIDKATGEWILSLDGDEELSPQLVEAIHGVLRGSREEMHGYYVPRQNFFLSRWVKHGGFWPDRKLRLFRRGEAQFENRAVHEDARLVEPATHYDNIGFLTPAILHHSYPTLTDYIDHMNRYSSLGAGMIGARGFSVINIVFRPLVTFIYNYFFRLGFLDGSEGLLLHLYHSVYVSWKYAKAWERGRDRQG